MRLFIALQLSEEMKKTLVACMHDLKKQGVEGNYVSAQNLHVTLAFIGEYEDPSKVKAAGKYKDRRSDRTVTKGSLPRDADTYADCTSQKNEGRWGTDPVSGSGCRDRFSADASAQNKGWKIMVSGFYQF